MRLTRWRVLRLQPALAPTSLLSQPAKMVAGVVAIMAAGAGLVFASGVYGILEAVLIVAAAFGLGAFAFVLGRVPRLYSWRYPLLSLDDHPRLAVLVADAARLSGYDAPTTDGATVAPA